MNILRKLSDWYFSKKAIPYWCILSIDCVVVLFSGLFGYYMECGGTVFVTRFWDIVLSLAIGLIPFITAFHFLHTYSGILRYSSFVDLQRVAIASLAGSVSFYIIGLIIDWIWPLQDTVLCPDIPTAIAMFFCSTLLLWLERVVVKRLFDSFHLDNAVPVAIYGTKAGGISLAKSIMAVKDKKYSLHAFISDGTEMKGAYLMGKPVYLNGEGIAKKLKSEGVKTLLVSPLKTERFRANNGMIDEFIAAGIKIMMMSNGEEWDGKSALTHQQLHEVEIDDLLPRDKIEVDMDAIGRQLLDHLRRAVIVAASRLAQMRVKVILLHVTCLPSRSRCGSSTCTGPRDTSSRRIPRDSCGRRR